MIVILITACHLAMNFIIIIAVSLQRVMRQLYWKYLKREKMKAFNKMRDSQKKLNLKAGRKRGVNAAKGNLILTEK